MTLATYAFGWMDLVSNNMLTGDWIADFTKSIKYYVGWVIPYWWLMNLMCALILSIMISVINLGIRKLKGINNSTRI